LTCSKCGNEEFHQAIRDIGLEPNRLICKCGHKFKAVFHPYPLAIALGDKWTTDANIIKGLYKGRDVTKVQRNKMDEMHTHAEHQTVNSNEES
jgi:hypothetical protein